MRTRWAPAAIAAIVILADRLSKLYIRQAIGVYDAISVIPGWFRIIHTENPGAAFGVLAEGNPILRKTVLIGVSGIVLCFVASALWSRASSFTASATRLGLSLILGGAIGNMFDRVASGTVTDFLEVYRGTWSFPAFNVADSAITVGSIFLFFDLLWPRSKRTAAPQVNAS